MICPHKVTPEPKENLNLRAITFLCWESGGAICPGGTNRIRVAVPSGGDCFFLHRALAGIHLPHGIQAAPCSGWCGWWKAHRKRVSETERKPSTRDLPRWLSDKESACQCRRPKRPDSRKIPWRRKWQPTPVFMPCRILGQGSLAGYSPQGRKELDTTEHAHTAPTLTTATRMTCGCRPCSPVILRAGASQTRRWLL